MKSENHSPRNTVFLTLCLMGAFAILSSTMSKNPVLGPFGESLGTPEEWSGFVASASTIPGILVSLPAASLSDVLGRRKFLIVAGFVFASAPFLYLLITIWWQLILVRFYHGFATAIFVPVAEASIAELFPAKRGERIALFSSATYVGRVIAPFLGGTILLVTSSGYHVLYLAVGLAGIAALVVGLAFLAERKVKNADVKKESAEIAVTVFRGWGTVIRKLGVLVACFIQSCQFYAFGVVEFYLSKYLIGHLEFDWLQTGIITGSLIAIPIVVKPFMGRVSDRIGRRTPIILGCVISAVPLLVVPFIFDFWILLLLALVYGFGFAAVTSVTPALVSELVPKELVGTSMGFLDMTMDVGQTLGPIVSGFILATSLQYAGVFLSLAVLLFVASAVFALLQVQEQA